MSAKSWECLEIHTKSFDQLNGLNRDVTGLMRQLKKKKHLERYFFNRYANDKKSEYFIKLGLVNSDKEAKSELNNLLEKHSVLKNIRYECEMWEVDGFPIDEIKCISCELFEKIRDSFEERLTISHIPYLLHFLMNQLGFGYETELEFYKKAEEIIKHELRKHSTLNE